MKHFPSWLIVVALVPPLAAGCDKPGTPNDAPSAPTKDVASAPIKAAPAPGYKVVSRRASSKYYVVEVQVTSGTPNGLLAKWSSDIAKAHKGKKNLQLNFYDAKPSQNSLIA